MYVATTLRRPAVASGRSTLLGRVRLADAGLPVVMAAYVAAAGVIPTLANVAVTDDWVYYRSVETLLVEHQLHVHDMSSAALVFQAVWGALFGAVFGLSFGTLRVSTVVMVGLSGLALYGVCRELGVSRGWSAVGTAAYLFHPLTLSLAYTFMTDPHFVGLLVIATWLYVRGLRAGQARPGWVVAGSVAAACGVLVRQQGLLIPAGVMAALLLSGRLLPVRRGLALLLQVCAVPAVTLVVYSAWLRFVNGTPWALTLFWVDLANAGWGGVLGLLPRLAFVQAIYSGLFVLPIVGAALPVLPSLRLGRWSIGFSIAWTAFVAGGTLLLWLDGQKTMPYVGQFITTSGLGPEDVIAARPTLLTATTRIWLTLVCALSVILAGWLLARRLGTTRRFFGSGAGVVAGVALGQLVGTVPASVHFAVWGGTLDRYLLPLLPYGVVLLLWALHGVRAVLPLAWLLVGLMGAISVAGTRDHLVWLDGVWSLAHEANELGVPDTRLDAGAGWDGLHVYVAPPNPSLRPRTPNPPWWADLFAPATDSSYVVAGDRLPNYAVVLEHDYWSWLRQRWLPLYLLRRPDVPGPP